MAQLRKTVWVSTQFEGYHRWVNAPDDVMFLRNYHRHLFKVRVGIGVRHNDRDVEFFEFKGRVDEYLTSHWHHKQFEASCEEIASSILTALGAKWVEVSEDGENGAIVENHGGGDTAHEEVRTKCFVGIEAEGPYRGKRLLFVPGSVSAAELRLAWSRVRDIWGIYYGAGNERVLNPWTMDVINQIRKENPSLSLQVEVGSTEDAEDARHNLVIGALSVIGFGASIEWDVDFRKTIENGTIIWKGKAETYYTSLDDPLFDQDRYV